ncbi:MAG: hypothetical protein ACREFJ_10850 [Acetobacteraceae bacterium]
MRNDWIGPDACKRRAHELENREAPTPKVYMGLAIVSAKQIRDCTLQVVDTRSVFEGHADIQHGVPAMQGEPLPAAQLLDFQERVKELAKIAVYYADPEPAETLWVGPPLHYRK